MYVVQIITSRMTSTAAKAVKVPLLYSRNTSCGEIVWSLKEAELKFCIKKWKSHLARKYIKVHFKFVVKYQCLKVGFIAVLSGPVVSEYIVLAMMAGHDAGKDWYRSWNLYLSNP
jgi:hypothetical protein